MTIILRSVKGAALTAAELDGNFEDLDGRMTDLEDNPPQANGIANITQDGSQITIHLDDASVKGPFTLPRPTQRPTETKTVSAATRTLILTDNMSLLRFTNAGGCAVTIDNNVAFLVDSEIHWWQDTDAGLTFTGTNGAVIRKRSSKQAASSGEKGAMGTLKKVSATEWLLFGLLADA